MPSGLENDSFQWLSKGSRCGFRRKVGPVCPPGTRPHGKGQFVAVLKAGRCALWSGLKGCPDLGVHAGQRCAEIRNGFWLNSSALCHFGEKNIVTLLLQRGLEHANKKHTLFFFFFLILSNFLSPGNSADSWHTCLISRPGRDCVASLLTGFPRQ